MSTITPNYQLLTERVNGRLGTRHRRGYIVDVATGKRGGKALKYAVDHEVELMIREAAAALEVPETSPARDGGAHQ